MAPVAPAGGPKPRPFFRRIDDQELATPAGIHALYLEVRSEGLALVAPRLFCGLVALALRTDPETPGARLRRLILFQAWQLVTPADRWRGESFAVRSSCLTGAPETAEEHEVAALLHARELDYLLYFDDHWAEDDVWH